MNMAVIEIISKAQYFAFAVDIPVCECSERYRIIRSFRRDIV